MTDSSENKEIINYLPHHGVIKPNKPGKIRVVFDAGAKCNGTSLNENLLKGPDYLRKLIGILIKFRREKYAIMGDIKEMYHQIFVSLKDRDALRFVWRKFPSDHIDDYRMIVHIFGKIDSPCIANWAIKKTAKDEIDNFSMRAILAILEHFYMDDYLDSFSSQSETIKICKEICEILKKGGFHLGKFVSNDKEILKALPQEDLSTNCQSVNLDLDNIPLERALGILWDPDNDIFKMS